MSMAAIGITSLALTGVSMGLSASGALNPEQPNLASSSAKLSKAKASLLPFQRAMEAAAAKGGDYTFQLPKGIKASDYGWTENGASVKQMVKVPSGNAGVGGKAGNLGGFMGLLSGEGGESGTGGAWVEYNAADFAPGGKYEGVKNPQIRTLKSKGDGTYTVSFKGYGTADTQGKLATQNAQNALKLSKKYDSQFIDSALEQEKLADPEGFAARKRMHELIHEQSDREPNHPVSDLLDRQVGEQLKAGRGLDRFDHEALDRAVAEATGARGGTSHGADFERPLTTGYAGEGRAAAARRKALAFASSGATPEDIDYRRGQQDMSNLDAEVNGVTPQSQFTSLSGAQNGPTPQVNGQPLPTMPGGTTAQAGQAALTGYNAQLAQPNQWMMGLSSLINAAGAAGKSGMLKL